LDRERERERERKRGGIFYSVSAVIWDLIFHNRKEVHFSRVYE